jgi:hypothetical protein
VRAAERASKLAWFTISLASQSSDKERPSFFIRHSSWRFFFFSSGFIRLQYYYYAYTVRYRRIRYASLPFVCLPVCLPAPRLTSQTFANSPVSLSVRQKWNEIMTLRWWSERQPAKVTLTVYTSNNRYRRGRTVILLAYYELQFDLARDVGLDYAPRQLFSSSSY